MSGATLAGAAVTGDAVAQGNGTQANGTSTTASGGANGTSGSTNGTSGGANGSSGGSSSNESSSGSGSSGSSGGKTHTVQMASENGQEIFDPIGLKVEPGDTVKWVIKSGSHSSTSYSPGNPSDNGADLIPKGAKSWNSGVLSGTGSSFSYTFEKEGTYDYYCIPHKQLGMVGRIVCGKPGGPAEKTSIPNKPKKGKMPSSSVIVKEGKIPFPFTGATSGSGGSSGAPAGSGGFPALFLGGFGLFLLTHIYMLAKSDDEGDRSRE